MIQAQQVAVSRSPTTALRQVAPQQLYSQQVTAPAQFDISTLLASIMPLIMLVLMFQMLKPMLGGMAGS